MELNEIIQAYNLEKSTDGNADCYRNGGILSSWSEMAKALPTGFTNVSGWDDASYRVVFISDKHLCIATYCEGDFSLTIAKDSESYKKEIVEHHNFYVNLSSSHYTDIEPEEQPIAFAAIEEIPGINEQPWRQHHLFAERTYDYDDAIISSPDKSVVWAKAAQIMMVDPEDTEKIGTLMGRKIEGFTSNLSLYCQHPPCGSGVYFGRKALYECLMSEFPDIFADINEPNTHPELKGWAWGYFDLSDYPFKDLPWVKGHTNRYQETGKSMEQYPSKADYLFDCWQLEKQGGVKITNPYKVEVTYSLTGQPFKYTGKVIAYRYVSQPSTKNPNISGTARKQYVIQPDDKCPESVAGLIYWLERSRFTIIKPQ